MTATRVEADSNRLPPAETNATDEPNPVEVAHFRAALAAVDAMGGDRWHVQTSDIAAMTASEAAVPAEQLFDLAADAEEPMPDDFGAGASREAGPDDMPWDPTRGMNAAWREHAWLPPRTAATTTGAVLPKKRVELGTHLARQAAMQPLADLLALVRQRAAGQAVPDLKIVPPEPNPLKLTLHLAMDGDEFVVKARTALGADRREEVQQALHVLETALAARLSMPARVVLLA